MAFTTSGFRSWKKVNDGKNCAFLNHIGKDPNSSHKVAMQCYHDLGNSLQHLDKIIEKQNSEQVAKNRLQLQVSIDAAKWCAFQAVAFRGHDESLDSNNRGNFIELIKHVSSYNEKVAAVVLDNAPRNASYTSPTIQKEILSIWSIKIQKHIREEISDSKFSILVDEAQDRSKREQMAIVLRFVDKQGYIRERFFDIVHVHETNSLTLKKEICDVLSRHNLSVQNIRGQGYDGASNMRGEWNGLQALFIQECPYAYYIHCFAHRLQLTLVATSQEVIPVEQFFTNLSLLINLVSSSCKRVDQLRVARAARIAELIAIDELETGRGQNQMGTLKRPGTTRWGSHFSSICSLFTEYEDICSVLIDVINYGNTSTQRSEADRVYDFMTSFDFVLVMHMMRDILGFAQVLSQALQCKSQDILNALKLVSVTKDRLQSYRDNGWNELFTNVKTFCDARNIEMPDMNVIYKAGRGRIRKQNDPITMEHHYRIDVFLATVDSQILEMKNRFKEDVIELLILSSALHPKDNFQAFNIEQICQLADKFYSADFTDQEKLHLRTQLELFQIEFSCNSQLQNLSSLQELCQVLAKTRKSMCYTLIDRLIRLILTLPVSTATTERAFSAMKIIKTCLRSRMEEDFLANSMIMYIEKEIARTFDVNSIIDDFDKIKSRRAQFHMSHTVK
nr:zinc finger MYM-type protein 1-like [Coffea arabica]